MQELLTLRELSQKLKMSQSWVRLQVYRGRIPVHRLGRNLRFSWPEVARALNLPSGDNSDEAHKEQNREGPSSVIR